MRHDRIGPVAGGILCCSIAFRRTIQREKTASAIILPMHKPKDVCQRTLAPMQRNLRRLQASRSARQISSHANCSRGLQEDATPPGLSLQLQFPAAGRHLVETSGDSRECEWELVVLDLEIDAAVIEHDSLEVIYWKRRRGRPVSGWVLRRNSFRGRKPAFEVPLTLIITNQNEARLAKRQRPKFKMTSKQAGPSQARTQLLRTQKILVTKSRILANRDAVRGELQFGKEARSKTFHLNGTAKRTLEMRDKVGVHSMGAH